MHPPHFDNPWLIVYLMYGYPVYVGMLYSTWVGTCNRVGRGLGVWEWATKSYKSPSAARPSSSRD